MARSNLGFPIHNFGPDRKAKRFLERQTEGERIALFVTHASPEELDELPGYLAKFRAAAGATRVGMFDCRGELAKGVKRVMSIMPDPKIRLWAKIDDSQGQPDAERLERARAFAREIMESVSQV